MPKRKVVPFEFIFHIAKVGKFWNQGSTLFMIFSLNQFGYWKNLHIIGKGLSGAAR
jgi:hypothetical protein